MPKPKIRYDYNEGVWYVEYQGQRSWARSRTFEPMIAEALRIGRRQAGFNDALAFLEAPWRWALTGQGA
jgi:hypothetical protein